MLLDDKTLDRMDFNKIGMLSLENLAAESTVDGMELIDDHSAYIYLTGADNKKFTLFIGRSIGNNKLLFGISEIPAKGA